MLHNSGPYGPNDVPVNMGASVNMTQMSSPMNVGNNLGNLVKIPQQTPQTSAPHYNMPDYPPFGHTPLNIGHSISPFSNYHHMNFQTNYGQSNPNMTHDTSQNDIQNGMLPMNLNIQSDHGPSLTNYHNFDSKRLDVNKAPYKDSFSQKMPINVPQLHTKAFQKHLGMESAYGQHDTVQETPLYSQDLSKTTERTLLDHDHDRRKSLENTVKLIENILINSTPKDKLKSCDSTESLQNTHPSSSSMDMTSTQQNSVNNNKKKQNASLQLPQKQSTNLNTDFHTEDLKKTTDIDDPKVSLSKEVDISNKIIDLKRTRLQNTNLNTENAKISIKQSKIHTDDSSINTAAKNLPSTNSMELTTKIQSEIHCEPLRRRLINNNRLTGNKIHKDTGCNKDTSVKDTFKKDTSDNSEDGTDSETEQSILHITIKEEIADDAVKVKVEPLESDVDNAPFLRDTNAVCMDMIEVDAVIVQENIIAEAQEALKKGLQQKTYYECAHCNILFKHPKRFLIHSKWHSFGRTNEKQQELVREKEKKIMKREAKVVERLNSKEAKEGAAESHPCKDCDKVFAVKSSLKNHRQRYHPTHVRECKICNASVVGWMAMRAHMAAHTGGGGYQCPECPKRFKYAHSLAKHKDTHLEKTHGCQQCEKKFGSQALLKMHMKCHERTARGATFRCTYCAKAFFESYNLQVHERTHRNERPFTCDICKTSFGTNSSLKRHIKVSHSTSKPFPCPTCQRCFASATTRARHTAREHSDPSTFAHACQICPRRYRALKELNRHVSKSHGTRE